MKGERRHGISSRFQHTVLTPGKEPDPPATFWYDMSAEILSPGGNPMGQEHSLYDDSPTAQMVHPWISRHLPRLDPTALHHLVQLVSGLLEHQSVLIEEIARGSAFRANPESNATQVRRIMTDPSIKTVLLPDIVRDFSFLTSLIVDSSKIRHLLIGASGLASACFRSLAYIPSVAIPNVTVMQRLIVLEFIRIIWPHHGIFPHWVIIGVKDIANIVHSSHKSLRTLFMFTFVMQSLANLWELQLAHAERD
jgi:hypothetical protein